MDTEVFGCCADLVSTFVDERVLIEIVVDVVEYLNPFGNTPDRLGLGRGRQLSETCRAEKTARNRNSLQI